MYDDYMKSESLYGLIGARIRESREKALMSQKTLAEAVGFESATAISLIETGERRVSIEDLANIAKALHVDPKYLLGQEEQKPNIKYALRADKELSSEDEEYILKFIEFIKSNRNGR